MKTIQELIIGSAVFLMIDRGARILSNYVTSKGQDETQKVSLRIELVILVLVILIAWKVF
jgi:hypothetical protein